MGSQCEAIFLTHPKGEKLHNLLCNRFLLVCIKEFQFLLCQLLSEFIHWSDGIDYVLALIVLTYIYGFICFQIYFYSLLGFQFTLYPKQEISELHATTVLKFTAVLIQVLQCPQIWRWCKKVNPRITEQFGFQGTFKGHPV